MTRSSSCSSAARISRGIGQRRRVARQQQRRRQHRLVELGEQRVRHRVRRHAHADGLLRASAPRHFARRAQDEGVAARRRALSKRILQRCRRSRRSRSPRGRGTSASGGAARRCRARAAGARGPSRRRSGSRARSRSRSDRRSGRRARTISAARRTRRACGCVGWMAKNCAISRARKSSISCASASGWSWCSMWPASGTVTWRRFANAARRSACSAGSIRMRASVSDSAASTHSTGAVTRCQQARASS